MQFKIDIIQLEKNIRQLNKIGEIYYPIKANSHINMLKNIKNIGETNNIDIKFQVFSKEHFNRALLSGIKPKKIQVANTRVSSKELMWYYEKGVKSFVLDSLKEALLFLPLTESIEAVIKIALSEYADIKVNTGADQNEITKLTELANFSGNKYGYSIYVQDSAKNLVRLDTIYGDIITKAKMEGASFISLGGVDYNELNKIIKLNRIDNNNVSLRIEPGRELLSNTESTILDIESIRIIDGYTSITVDSSIHSEFIDRIIINKEFKFEKLYNKDMVEIENVSKISKDNKNIKNISVYGNCGCSYDYIGEFIVKNSTIIEIGQKIEVVDIGAYFGRQ